MSFEKQLQVGRAGESYIARFMQSHGYLVVPAYEKIINSGKGPQVYGVSSSYVAPDLFVFNGEKAFWIEAKHKTAFTWHRKSDTWQTGIDLHHYEDYLKVQDASPFNVWLLFLHEGGQAKDSPADSPSGLYGNKLNELRHCEHHRHSNHGRHGMVYWTIDDLIEIASLQKVLWCSTNQVTTGTPVYSKASQGSHSTLFSSPMSV